MEHDHEEKALDLYGREYSREELKQKLSQKDYAADEIDTLLDTLAKEDCKVIRVLLPRLSVRVLSVDMVLFIANELGNRGVDSVLLNALVNTNDWLVLLKQLWQKKFDKPRSPAAYAKQYRFKTAF